MWLVLYPILIVVHDAAEPDALAAFVSRPGEWRVLWASVWISVASVALAAAIGVPLAFLFEWLEVPGRKTLGSVIALPAVPPPVGGGFRVMTTQIVATKLNGELPLAMVETVALALVAVLGFALLRRTEGDDILTALGKGTAPRRRPIRRAGVRTFATTAGWVLAVVLLLPHLTLVLVSLVPYGTWTTETLPPVLSLVNYQRLFSEAERLRPLVNSVWMAAASTVAAVLLGPVGGARCRGTGPPP